jgi:hypothetical protein
MTIWDDVDQCYIDAEVVWSGRGPLPHQTLEDGWYHQVLRSSLERAAAFNEDLPSQAEVRSWKGVDAPDWREEFTKRCLELGTKVSASDAMGRPTHWPEGW